MIGTVGSFKEIHNLQIGVHRDLKGRSDIPTVILAKCADTQTLGELVLNKLWGRVSGTALVDVRWANSLLAVLPLKFLERNH